MRPSICPHEGFGHFELTDEHGGEQLDRIPVVAGEIRIGDRAYLQPDRIAAVLERAVMLLCGPAGATRVGWMSRASRSICTLTVSGQRRIDRPTSGSAARTVAPLALRLIAIRKPDAAAETARRQVRQQGRKSGYTPSRETLDAASWLIIVTSLRDDTFLTDDVLALYRLRWRIELGFKRLKSLVGLKKPPGIDDRSARPWVLAHLLMILLLEPLVDALRSPRWASAA